ncbi:MAG: DUF1592 domain-containing protein, partial [Bradyrhizobium sp.]
KAVRKLRARHMPPVGLPRPDESTYNAVIASLEKTLDGLKPDPGRTDTFRRLNRTEYRNSIRDLLALDVDVSSLLPADESSYGFDNVTVGDLPPALLERYVAAAGKIARLAVGSPISKPGGDTVILPPDLTQEQHFEDLPIGTRGGTSVRYTFPLDAEYDITVRLARDRNEHVEGLTEAHEVEFLLDGERIGLFTVRPPKGSTDHSQVDKDLTLRLAVKAGPHVVAAAFPKKPTLLLETERQPYEAHFNMDRHPRITPAVYSVSVTGPFQAQGPGETPSRKRLFVCRASGADDEGCAKRILATVMRRAYRRPVTDGDLERPLRFYRESRRDGFENGIEMALRAVLVSPEFLFRVEQDPAGVAPKTAYKVADLELASRLSFFLWSSIPDDELLAVAESGKLSDKSVLSAQMQRMLKDPRSSELVKNFIGQYLYLRNIERILPDSGSFPNFDENLRPAMAKETELVVESTLREDRSVADLLNTDYTYLNQRLAEHYGIKGVYGNEFRRVALTDPRRHGLLGQASILTVTSYPNRTAPTIRGKWVLLQILGTPPPPPPPNVPSLKDDATTKNLTMRERMELHRSNPTCAACHRLMDPLGFALENFDGLGQWRDSIGTGGAIDASGVLPDGTKFDGPAGLREVLMSKRDMFVETFTEQLLTYALGRGVEEYDRPVLRQILREAHSEDYRWSSIILGIINSAPFQMRRVSDGNH